MASPLRHRLNDMAHESTVHFANKLVHRRTQLEPVKSFLVEDLIMNKGSKKIAKQ